MKSNTQKSLIDLFAGCGGLSLGLEQAGFSTVFANEIWDAAAETYRRNRNMSDQEVFVGDIKYLVEHLSDFPIPKDVTLVCGGPPCQGFSMGCAFTPCAKRSPPHTGQLHQSSNVT